MSITQGSKIKLSAVNHINKIFPKMPENIILDAVSEGYSLLLQSDFKSNNEYLQICWLIKTSKRIIYKELKKRKRELLFSELTNDSVDSDNNIENLLIDEQPEQNIGYNLDTEIILNYFSEKEREFIKLLDEGYSFQEIANKFSKSIAAIYQMAHRIKLKNQMIEELSPPPEEKRSANFSLLEIMLAENNFYILKDLQRQKKILLKKLSGIWG